MSTLSPSYGESQKRAREIFKNMYLLRKKLYNPQITRPTFIPLHRPIRKLFN